MKRPTVASQPKVQAKSLQPAWLPEVTRTIAGEPDVAHRAMRLEPRVPFRKAVPLELALFHRAMELEFLGQIRIEPSKAHEIPHPAEEPVHGVPHVALRTF